MTKPRPEYDAAQIPTITSLSLVQNLDFESLTSFTVFQWLLRGFAIQDG